MARSKSRMTAEVAAVFRPAVRFSASSVWERRWVRAFISAMRAGPWPNWMVSERPRRLSRTKAESPPDWVRKRRPLPPLRLEVIRGMRTPTVP